MIIGQVVGFGLPMWPPSGAPSNEPLGAFPSVPCAMFFFFLCFILNLFAFSVWGIWLSYRVQRCLRVIIIDIFFVMNEVVNFSFKSSSTVSFYLHKKLKNLLFTIAFSFIF